MIWNGMILCFFFYQVSGKQNQVYRNIWKTCKNIQDAVENRKKHEKNNLKPNTEKGLWHEMIFNHTRICQDFFDRY